MVRAPDNVAGLPFLYEGVVETEVAGMLPDAELAFLDEVMSHLDAHLKFQMLFELKRIHQSVGKTTVYVTHDRIEALSLSDTIAVMREGRIVEIGTPRQIYFESDRRFVADFIGETDFVPGQVLECAGGFVTVETAIGRFEGVPGDAIDGPLAQLMQAERLLAARRSASGEACLLLVDDDQDYVDTRGYYTATLEALSYDYEVWDVLSQGPPTANGRPGIHHVIARTMKDFGCRFKTMQGYRVERKAGWDTHGLPVEIEVEKQLGFTNKQQIEDYGIDKFNELCKKSVFRYINEWEKMTERIAFWVDLDEAYITYKNEYIQSVWWILKEFFTQGLLYQGHKVVPYCPRCGKVVIRRLGYIVQENNIINGKCKYCGYPIAGVWK